MKVIAHIRTDFPTKFGVPRQSGLTDVKGRIIFEKEFSDPDAVRGLEQFSHIWILWAFSLTEKKGWSATVRPPRLGGNKRMGVFATRSPYRPNAIGLSSVKLEKIEYTARGAELIVSGADLTDGTPIYDIKPYLPYTDSHPDACGGFADRKLDHCLDVDDSSNMLAVLPAAQQQQLISILSQDPRPSYQKDENRLYGFEFSQYHVEFRVKDHALTIVNINKI